MYRSRSEVIYVAALSRVFVSQLEEWRDQCEPDQRALLYERPQLVREFRYLRKDCLLYTSDAADD